MQSWDDSDLHDLRWHWGGAYAILHPRPDVWIASRRDNWETLRAESPGELRDKIHVDYFTRKVPRQSGL
jgi:hypothetical protein